MEGVGLSVMFSRLEECPTRSLHTHFSLIRILVFVCMS